MYPTLLPALVLLASTALAAPQPRAEASAAPVTSSHVHALFTPDKIPCNIDGVASCVDGIQRSFFACSPKDIDCQCTALVQLELACYGICPQSQLLLEIATTINDVCAKLAAGIDKDEEHEPQDLSEEKMQENEAVLDFNKSGDLELKMPSDAAVESDAAPVAEPAWSEPAVYETPAVSEEPAWVSEDESIPSASEEAVYDVSEDTTYAAAVSEQTTPPLPPAPAPPAPAPTPEPTPMPVAAPPASPASDPLLPAVTPAANATADDTPTAVTSVAVFEATQTVLADASATATVTYPHFSGYTTEAATPKPSATGPYYYVRENATSYNASSSGSNTTYNGTYGNYTGYGNTTGNYSSNSTSPALASGSANTAVVVGTTLVLGAALFVAAILV
ncbi:uncharacterized protein V1518DRAFT_421667 [Limtongia smithiae]|uniref:uncharacterized protein n=1 Tax=Limtongia smithiae TaxID=1125753 RepID=UPI0034CD45DC